MDQQHGAVNDLQRTEDHITVQLEVVVQEITALEKDLANLRPDCLNLEGEYSQTKELKAASKDVL